MRLIITKVPTTITVTESYKIYEGEPGDQVMLAEFLCEGDAKLFVQAKKLSHMMHLDCETVIEEEKP